MKIVAIEAERLRLALDPPAAATGPADYSGLAATALADEVLVNTHRPPRRPTSNGSWPKRRERAFSRPPDRE